MAKKSCPGRVVAAMSGGVDSSVAAALLKERGYEVIGVTILMRHPCASEEAKRGVRGPTCPHPGQRDAKKVCDSLGIPHHYVDMRERFERSVVDYFLDEYSRGRTPNPCVICNRDIKFATLLDLAKSLEAEFVATGHYARVSYDDGRQRYVLKKGIDPLKDQSYALCGLDQRQLGSALFPLGTMTKEKTRSIARRLGLTVAEKPESQEICFIEGDYRDFLESAARAGRLKMRSGLSPGPIEDTGGRVLGTHRGFARYTVGQRRGLGISSPQPLYVLAIDPSRNAVIVGPERDLLSRGLIAAQVNMVSIEEFKDPTVVGVKIRYRSPEARAVVNPSDRQDVITVHFDTPQRAVTPGQIACLYSGDEVLAGGVIERAL
ncbi:MAG TPA: tRNA 2-thiouridine(34) synthase MnmA [Clostridia bacterium]|nr:tRNA 2-thiouridine(34) synthase MnmA [Clostridia bacterium]